MKHHKIDIIWIKLLIEIGKQGYRNLQIEYSICKVKNKKLGKDLKELNLKPKNF